MLRGVLLDRLTITTDELARGTGWEIKPEGACRDDVCVPLGDLASAPDGTVDVRRFADLMGMPIAADTAHGLHALGPRAGGKVLDGVTLPDIVLPDFGGQPFALASLRGRKVLLLAWASW
jgi:hypothetical protein